MSDWNEKFIIKMMDVPENIEKIKTNVEWIIISMTDQSITLKDHDKRLRLVEQDIMIIKDRRSIVFKTIRYLGSFIGWKL